MFRTCSATGEFLSGTDRSGRTTPFASATTQPSNVIARLPVSQPLIPGLAQQLGGGPPQPRHGRAKPGQFPEGQRFLGADDGRQMRHGLAATGDDYLFAAFHLVQKFAETCLRLSQIDGDLVSLKWS